MTQPNYTIDMQHTDIPVAPEDLEEFKAWTAHYGMNIKRKKNSDYYTVYYTDATNLYWLGANMFGNIETSALSQHGPDSVVKARTK